MDMVELVCGREQKKLKKISLPNDTVRCRFISDMPLDILDQVTDQIRANTARVSLQLAEWTDVSNCMHLLVFCRHVLVSELKEEFLMYGSQETTSKTIDVLEKMYDFFHKVISLGITLAHFAQATTLLCSVLS